MSYVQDNLMPNEKVLFSARIHPAIILPAVLAFITSIAILIIAVSLGSQQDVGASMASCLVFLMAAAFFLSSIAAAVQAFIAMRTTEFAVTNRRIVAKRGFIRRRSLEMLLPKVESVAVQQNVLGRLLNFGTVTVTGTGGTTEGFPAIVDPLTLRNKINQIIEYFTQKHPDR